MTEHEFVRAAPDLEPPHRVILRLAQRLSVVDEPLEEIFLNAANVKHRWAKTYFPKVDDEFRFKVVWVARLVRQALGSPSHTAFSALPALIGLHRAAAWRLPEQVVGFVSLRALRGRRRPRVRVMLGVIKFSHLGDSVAVHAGGPKPVSQAEEKLEVLRQVIMAVVHRRL